MLRVAVVGAAGKMGTATVRALASAPDLDLVAKVGRADNLRDVLRRARAEIAIDFTTPEVVEQHLDCYLAERVRPVVGTTGLSESALARILAAGRELKLGGVIAPNFSLGAALMVQLATQAARYLSEVEIVEYHHPLKKDAPSGTALRTKESLLTALPAGSRCPVHSVRLSGFLAHQEVILGGRGERLTIRHDALDRDCYMTGLLFSVRAVMEHNEIIYGLEKLLLDRAAN
ncbi:MAG: 4-hydroxy-tetrahydrodipicolinate reductase [Planctomycetota bacterium]